MEVESVLLFQDDISYWEIKITRLLRSKQEILLSQFQYYSSLKQTPTPRMHINLPKMNINSILWRRSLSTNYLSGMLKGLPLTENNRNNSYKMRALRQNPKLDLHLHGIII